MRDFRKNDIICKVETERVLVNGESGWNLIKVKGYIYGIEASHQTVVDASVDLRGFPESPEFDSMRATVATKINEAYKQLPDDEKERIAIAELYGQVANDLSNLTSGISVLESLIEKDELPGDKEVSRTGTTLREWVGRMRRNYDSFQQKFSDAASRKEAV